MPRVRLFYLLHLLSRLSFKCAPAPITHFCISGHSLHQRRGNNDVGFHGSQTGAWAWNYWIFRSSCSHPHCRDSVHDAAGAFEKSKVLLKNHREKRSVFRFAPLRSLGCREKGITNETNVYCLVCDQFRSQFLHLDYELSCACSLLASQK